MIVVSEAQHVGNDVGNEIDRAGASTMKGTVALSASASRGVSGIASAISRKMCVMAFDHARRSWSALVRNVRRPRRRAR